MGTDTQWVRPDCIMACQRSAGNVAALFRYPTDNPHPRGRGANRPMLHPYQILFYATAMASSIDEKLSVVRSLDFGSGVAEDEKTELASYFLETDIWRQVWLGKIDLILAPKGGGKSAIYSTLMNRQNILAQRKILLAPAENPQGEPAFQSLIDKNPSEDELREIWKIYFASIISEQLVNSGSSSDEAKELHEKLVNANLVSGAKPKRKVLQSIWAYVIGRISPEKLEATIELNPITGLPAGLTGGLTFPTASGSTAPKQSEPIDDSSDLFDLAQAALARADKIIWICIDRLDAAFATAPELERNALRALFRVYLDLQNYDRVAFKMFLRSDIWKQITAEGFREKSHIVRKRTITWTEASLLQLVTRRLVKSEELLAHYDFDGSAVVSDANLQTQLFDQVFPKTVDTGSGKTKNLFRWCINHTRDGLGVNAPRELVSLFANARNAQVDRFETGTDDTEGEAIFHPKAFEVAEGEVSSERLESTVYAEYPDVKPYLEALRGEKGAQNNASLARIWGSDDAETAVRITRLVDIGIFEKRKDHYWTPFLYRPALGIVQGGAPELKGVGDTED